MIVSVLLLGIFLLVVALRGKERELFDLLIDDFVGPNSFVPWIVALIFIWAIGLYKPFQPISRAFMVLVLIVLFLSRGTGFFDQLIKQTGIKV